MHCVVLHPASYDNCAVAVARAFKTFPLEMAGKKVLIKPNLLRSSSADEHIVTHPALLKAVVGKVATLAPADIVVGDNPGLFGYGDNEKCFQETGLTAAALAFQGAFPVVEADACITCFCCQEICPEKAMTLV